MPVFTFSLKFNATIALATKVQGHQRRRAQAAREAPAPAECVSVYPPMWMAAMQAAVIETAITGEPPPPPPECAWMLRTWLQCHECVRAVAKCQGEQHVAAASVPVEDVAGAISDQHLAEDDYTLELMAQASQRARRRRAETAGSGTDPSLPEAVQAEIDQILAALGLTLPDVKVSVDGDTTTVQIAKCTDCQVCPLAKCRLTLAAVEEAVSATSTAGVELSLPVSDDVVIEYAPVQCQLTQSCRSANCLNTLCTVRQQMGLQKPKLRIQAAKKKTACKA